MQLGRVAHQPLLNLLLAEVHGSTFSKQVKQSSYFNVHLFRLNGAILNINSAIAVDAMANSTAICKLHMLPVSLTQQYSMWIVITKSQEIIYQVANMEVAD